VAAESASTAGSEVAEPAAADTESAPGASSADEREPVPEVTAAEAPAAIEPVVSDETSVNDG
jgi:hypothetical protein